MERRKILLGSGAALTTALAGCTGSGDSDDDESDDDTESITDENGTDDGDGNGDESEQADGDGNGDESTETDDTTGSDDEIPGFDSTNLELESDAVSITSIERDGETVEVVATSETADYEELYGELEPLADDLAQAVVDADAFAEAIETLEWVVDHDEMKVVSFTVETAWLVDYREGDLSKDEFLAKVEATAE